MKIILIYVSTFYVIFRLGTFEMDIPHDIVTYTDLDTNIDSPLENNELFQLFDKEISDETMHYDVNKFINKMMIFCNHSDRKVYTLVLYRQLFAYYCYKRKYKQSIYFAEYLYDDYNSEYMAYNLGVSYNAVEDHSRAEYYFLKCLELNNPTDIKLLKSCYYNLIKIYYNQKNYSKMKDYLDKGILLNEIALTELMLLYYEEIEPDCDKKIQYEIKLIELGSSNAMVRLYQHYKDKNEMDEAIKYLDMAINEKNPEAYRRKGLLYFDEGDVNMMVQMYEKAIEGGNIEVYTQIGVYYLNLKNYTKARQYFEEGVKKNNGPCMTNLGVISYKEGDFENAKKYFEMAVEKHDDPMAKQNLEILLKKIEELESSKTTDHN